MRWLDGITDQCTWVWINLRSWWRTWRPDVLQFLGLQRARHNLETELNWKESVKGIQIMYIGNIINVAFQNLVQFSSVAQSCPTLWTPWIAACQASLSITNSWSSPRLTSIESVMPSHPLLSPSPSAPNPSQHQSLFQWVNSSHEVAKVLEFQL